MSKINLPDLEVQLAKYAGKGHPALLPALQDAQSLYGYLPEHVAEQVGRTLKVPLADVHGVIEFYSLFYSEPVGRKILQLCSDPPCAMAGSEAVLQALCRHFGISESETSSDGEITIERAPCLGLCSHAPAVLVGSPSGTQIPIGNADQEKPDRFLHSTGKTLRTPIYGSPRILTANCGKDQPYDIANYEASGGYRGLRQALNRSPELVRNEVRASGLVGRGGAAFPTAVKWDGVAQAQGNQKYVVCNGDESEPGTFKDRVLMEDDPHQIIEGMIIAGYAVGASKGWVYIRGEYHNAYQVIIQAVEEAQKSGYLGKNILGSGFNFEIEIRLGAGAYICGEETALFESIEGKRGYPRIKPPFPTTHGLFGLPTAINNVETLSCVPHILKNGAQAYRRFGTEKSPGTKLFCLSGDVAKPGLYEVPFGISLRHLIFELAGGVKSGGGLQAVLLGGAAGKFAKPDQLDVEMSFEGLTAAGLPLGSGVVIVIDQKHDIREILLGLCHFFAHESCGKCYPCQMGTQRQWEIMERIATDEALTGDTDRLRDVGWTMSDASICGLGQTAASAVLSAIQLWPHLFEEFLGDR